jgi:hypothetical protein
LAVTIIFRLVRGADGSDFIPFEDGVVMFRRSFALLVIAVSSVAGLAGCDSLKQMLRPSKETEAHSLDSEHHPDHSGVETDPTKIHAVDADPKSPKPFFRNNRSAGGWSSEAREIEGHLGVGP